MSAGFTGRKLGEILSKFDIIEHASVVCPEIWDSWDTMGKLDRAAEAIPLAICGAWDEVKHDPNATAIERELALLAGWNETLRMLDNARNTIKRMSEFIVACRDGFDCDADSHRYGTRCRACSAESLIPKTSEKP